MIDFRVDCVFLFFGNEKPRARQQEKPTRRDAIYNLGFLNKRKKQKKT